MQSETVIMKRQDLYEKMLEVASQVFARVELARGDFRGGLCMVRGEEVLFLNRSAGMDANLRTLANALAHSDKLEDIYILPVVRSAIDQYSDPV